MIFLEAGFIRYNNAFNKCKKENLLDFACRNNYSVEEISLNLGISPRQLERIFNDSLGLSPKSWLREQRVIRARQLLHSGQSLKFVYYNLGFKTQSHFIKEFRYFFEMTPTEYLEACLSRRAA